MDVPEFETALLQADEETKSWCPASGENVGRMIGIPGSDEWKVACPTCGTWWHGGSTVLVQHERA